MQNLISYERARATGVLNEHDEVSYEVSIDGRKRSAVATFHYLGTPEATLAARCCFLWNVPVFQPDGIVVRVEQDGVVAHVIADSRLRSGNFRAQRRGGGRRIRHPALLRSPLRNLLEHVGRAGTG